jgi:nucleotidyltransferase/DNA polymerase involved in DNA repair
MGAPSPIGHLDADCFYVSAERARRPFLAGKPVGVLGNQGACVIAKSYEMKAAGVKTGMAVWDAVRLCPHGVYVKRDFRWYEVLSRLMLGVVREFSPTVEFYSVDEFFFHAVPTHGLSLEQTILRLRDAVQERVGVPVTVGVARTRMLAKLVSDTAKPAGVRVLLGPDEERRLLADLPVTEITGIARRRAARLAPYGIHTCLDFVRADRRLVRELITIAGEALWYELRGEGVIPLHTERPPHKTLSRGGSLGEHTADPHRLHAWVVRNLERLIEELEHHAVRAGRLAVWLNYRDGRTGAAEASPEAPTDRFDLLAEVARRCLRRAWDGRGAVDRVHVIATQLCRPGMAPGGLFEPPAGRARALARLKRAVNARHGRFALRSGATLPLTEIYRDEAQSYDICDIRGKICF